MSSLNPADLSINIFSRATYHMLDNRLKNFSKSIKTVDTNQQ